MDGKSSPTEFPVYETTADPSYLIVVHQPGLYGPETDSSIVLGMRWVREVTDEHVERPWHLSYTEVLS
jgi:hypothetical protein